MNLEAGPQRRRRGAELESAILAACWSELTERGYGALTIDAVAQRAGTSRTVVYRRWATKRELVEATISHVGGRQPPTPPHTGSLREDLLTVMRFSNEHRIGLTALVAAFLGDYFLETGTTPYDLRRLVVADEAPSVLDAILAEAEERGEVPAGLPRRVANLAFDLFRYEALMRLGPVPEEVMTEIVDDVFVPLATGSVVSGS